MDLFWSSLLRIKNFENKTDEIAMVTGGFSDFCVKSSLSLRDENIRKSHRRMKFLRDFQIQMASMFLFER